MRSMAVNLGRAVNLSDVAAETRTIFGGGYEEHAMLNESADVEMDDVDLRESFADLAMKQGRLPPTLGSGKQKQPAAAAPGEAQAPGVGLAGSRETKENTAADRFHRGF